VKKSPENALCWQPVFPTVIVVGLNGVTTVRKTGVVSMFTGIVQGTAKLVSIDEKPNFRTMVELPEYMLDGLETGASVAHNGCCLTVTEINGNQISFDLMKETLRITNLGELAVGDTVNVERAAKFSDEIGGHLMSGHIMTTAEVAKIVTSENNRQIWFKMQDPTLMKYILYKGFIGIDGISLTVGEVTPTRFCVHLIPETSSAPRWGEKTGASCEYRN
jgi:riboflavin synthase